jgi:hypothetical protein
MDPQNIKNNLYQWIWVVIFAIAFAWVESAVVVYLRDIFYGGDFHFPLVIGWEGGKRNPSPLIWIEFGREVATLVMLFSVGWAAGRNLTDKFAFFIIAFGVWDIFYYIWLDVMIKWPQSLMTWDLLFFVPLPWVGPVITPVLIALAMVGIGSLLVYYSAQKIFFPWRWYDGVIESVLCLLMIIAFCWDWRNIMQIPGYPDYRGIPNPFAWWLYLPAYSSAVTYFVIRVVIMRRARNSAIEHR